MSLLKNLHYRPKNLFLIDGLGALLSAFLLGVVLVRWQVYFGIPTQVLYFLALLPCLFALYDFYCFRANIQNIGTYLKGIAILNIFYCLLSIGLAIYHYRELTYLGWLYINFEVVIVVLLSLLELSIAQKQNKK